MPEDPQVPHVIDRTPKVTNFLQDRKIVGLGLAALIIVLVVMFSNTGAPVRKQAPPNPSQEIKPVTPEQARTYSTELQKQATMLEQQQKYADTMKRQAETLAAQVPAGGVVPAPQYVTPAPAIESKPHSNIALSFRSTSQTSATAPIVQSADAGIKELIEAEKAAIAANIAASSRPPAPVAPVIVPAQAPSPEVVKADESVGKKYKLFEGFWIESVLVNRLNGSYTGSVKVMVTNPVYSHDREHVLIPQGTFILGEAQKVGSQGQQRLAVVFHRMVMPDGYNVSLDQFTGLNAVGETGLKDKVDHHFMQLFGTSIALGLVSGFSQFGTGSALTSNGVDQYRQGVANSVGQSSSQILAQQFTSVLPTITIREGHRVKIWLRQDLDLPALEDHRVPGNL